MAAGPHAIKVADVHIGKNKQKLLFILCTSKTHDKGSKPQQIKISSIAKVQGIHSTQTVKCEIKAICPYQVLWDYIKVCPKYFNKQEPFFVFSNNQPVSPANVRTTLKMILASLGFNAHLYNCHSLRIGRSCDLLEMGVLVETIKQLGRWKSNIVYKYLK